MTAQHPTKTHVLGTSAGETIQRLNKCFLQLVFLLRFGFPLRQCFRLSFRLLGVRGCGEALLLLQAHAPTGSLGSFTALSTVLSDLPRWLGPVPLIQRFSSCFTRFSYNSTFTAHLMPTTKPARLAETSPHLIITKR